MILSGNIALEYCINEDMLADLFTKIVTSAQDKRLTSRFYNDCVMDAEEYLPEPEEDEYVERLVKATDKYEAAIAMHLSMQPESLSTYSSSSGSGKYSSASITQSL